MFKLENVCYPIRHHEQMSSRVKCQETKQSIPHVQQMTLEFSKIMDFDQTHKKNADREDYEMNLTVLTHVLRSRDFIRILVIFFKTYFKTESKNLTVQLSSNLMQAGTCARSSSS